MVATRPIVGREDARRPILATPSAAGLRPVSLARSGRLPVLRSYPQLSAFKPITRSDYASARAGDGEALRGTAGAGGTRRAGARARRTGAAPRDVWPALELGDEPAGLLYAVNREYAEPRPGLADGDEVALIPPVSGGAFVSTEEPLSLEPPSSRRSPTRARARSRRSPARRAASRAADACTTSTTRRYEGMAEEVMARLAAELKARYELHEIAIHHRVGRVEIGEACVVIAVSAPHRADALAACKDAIDTLKETVPLWKKEVYEGGEEWIGEGFLRKGRPRLTAAADPCL